MSSKIDLFNIEIDPLTRSEAVDAIFTFFRESSFDAHMVVTPNVDHVVKLHGDSGFLDAYNDASLVLVDGNPVVWAAKLLGKHVPETVPGSDLAVLLFEQAKHGDGFSVFLLGAPPGVAEKAGKMIEGKYKNVRVVGSHCPPLGFERNPEELDLIVQQIDATEPDLLLVGLGAPKQELWAHNNKKRLKAKVVLCAGATIEFIAQEKQRAPLWVQKIAMEWFYRMLLEPKRLISRYLKDAVFFPFLVVQEILKQTIR